MNTIPYKELSRLELTVDAELHAKKRKMEDVSSRFDQDHIMCKLVQRELDKLEEAHKTINKVIDLLREHHLYHYDS